MAKLKLTPELQATICEKIAAVATFRDACTLAGVDDSTAFKWLKKGEAQRRGVYRRFFDAVEVAKAQRRTGLKAKIRVLGNNDWRALQALGAMTDPEQFVPQVRVIIASELDKLLDRVRVRFADQPEIYAAVLEAVAAGDVPTEEPKGEPDAPADGSREEEPPVVQPALPPGGS